jgi:uncharacterized membrane protein
MLTGVIQIAIRQTSNKLISFFIVRCGFNICYSVAKVQVLSQKVKNTIIIGIPITIPKRQKQKSTAKNRVR